jgi:ABC-type Fe3+-siderophore transport system permease subunit
VTLAVGTRSRRLLGLVFLLVLVVVAALASIAVGTRSIGLGEVWRSLIDGDLSTDAAVIVRQLRVPRTALGLLVGLALGVAGALMQGHTRNPLGDPGLLGVTAGASLAVVLAIAWFGIGTPSGYVWFAFAGALVGTVLVYVIGSAGRGGPTPVTLALAGAALSALL